MTDVATLAGVSQTTVSLVLNDAIGARLSGKTRQRVLDAAAALGYRLVKRNGERPEESATTIGVMEDEMSTDPWCAIALDGIREKAWEHGLTVSVAVTRGDPEMEQAAHAQFQKLPLLGLIYGTIQTRQIEVASWFAPSSSGVPTVLLNCYAADRALPSVTPSEVVGGRIAT